MLPYLLMTGDIDNPSTGFQTRGDTNSGVREKCHLNPLKALNPLGLLLKKQSLASGGHVVR